MCKVIEEKSKITKKSRNDKNKFQKMITRNIKKSQRFKNSQKKQQAQTLDHLNNKK